MYSRIVFALILAFILSVTALLPAAAEAVPQDAARSQIERIVVSYAAEGTRDVQALSALTALDPALGE